jgi:D-beta-D-heptose 7-phosphate kinase/D-beta-D-heptose 1-phosphate adenosyltransferase
MNLSPARASDLMASFADCDLLVVGDLMLDRYVSGTVDRISPEAPVPILHARHERSVPGGACNVALNIRALGGRSRICGAAGLDEQGEVLMQHLAKAGVDTSAVVRTAEINTVVKTRFVSGRQQLLRVDHEDPAAMEALSSEALERALDVGLDGVQGVILEDYGKGLLQQPVVTHVLGKSREQGIPCGYDPKDNHELDVRGITFATPNRKETFQVANVTDRTPDADPLQDPNLLRASHALVDLWQPRHLLMTLGAQGMLLNNAQHEPVHLPTRAREVFDVSGAGDTVIATVLLALAAGADFVEAAELANVAAGLVVAKSGTATTTCREILDALEDRS